jgi:hypothetical protein
VQIRPSQHAFDCEQDPPGWAQEKTSWHNPGSPGELTQLMVPQQSRSAVQISPVPWQKLGAGHSPFTQLSCEQQTLALVHAKPFGTQAGGGGGGGGPASTPASVPASTTGGVVTVWQKAPNSVVTHWPKQQEFPPGVQAFPSGTHALWVHLRVPLWSFTQGAPLQH